MAHKSKSPAKPMILGLIVLNRVSTLGSIEDLSMGLITQPLNIGFTPDSFSIFTLTPTNPGFPVCSEITVRVEEKKSGGILLISLNMPWTSLNTSQKTNLQRISSPLMIFFQR
jgi:hypothetical protein